jgi:CBS domain-containing protein
MQNKIKVHEVLKANENTSVSEMSRKLKENKDRRIFIVDEKDMLKGLVTTTDLVYKALSEGNTEMLAKDIMTKDVATIDVKDDLEKAIEIMNELKSFVCPVTDNGKIVGLISYHDLMDNIINDLNKK